MSKQDRFQNSRVKIGMDAAGVIVAGAAWTE
jgi:hypothetical protein